MPHCQKRTDRPSIAVRAIQCSLDVHVAPDAVILTWCVELSDGIVIANSSVSVVAALRVERPVDTLRV